MEKSATKKSQIEELEELKNLYEGGLISKDNYEHFQKIILQKKFSTSRTVKESRYNSSKLSTVMISPSCSNTCLSSLCSPIHANTTERSPIKINQDELNVSSNKTVQTIQEENFFTSESKLV